MTMARGPAALRDATLPGDATTPGDAPLPGDAALLREAPREAAARRAPVALAVSVWLALLAAGVPLVGVIAPGPWVAAVMAMTAAMLTAGLVVRARGLPAWAASTAEALVAVLLLTVFFAGPAVAASGVGLQDTPALVPRLFRTALDEIVTGVAPLDASVALSFGLAATAAAVTLVADHVAVTARMPLAASVALFAVWLVPTLAVPAPLDAPGFAVLAASTLFLIRTETRTRETHAAHASPAVAVPVVPPVAARGTTATAVSIGLVSILVAAAATPLLPQPAARDVAPAGTGPGINASLDLGRSLRRTTSSTVLTLQTSGADAPYLRVATLSTLRGRVWLPDTTSTTPLEGARGLGAVAVAPDVALQRTTTTVRVDSLRAGYLPVPYAATGVSGVGAGWKAMTENRTVVSDGASTVTGLAYTVTSEASDPTLEQIRAASAQVDVDPAARGVPDDLPSVIRADARRVTAGATDDYDRLIALQSWFRGPDFTYSLSAPVKGGFDGSGAQAVAEFLRVKEGYCIHFAAAFTLMARALGMTARIVVGYLPGTPADVQGTPTEVATYDVVSSQLHAWPEVYFSGIGWVGFDPTKSLGQPTDILPAAATANTGASLADPAAPLAAPVPTATPSPRQRQTAADAAPAVARSATPVVLPWAGGAVALLVVLMLPACAGAFRRRRQDAASRQGDVLAAYTSVQDAAIDLGIPVTVGESVRAFGRRLVARHGADASATAVLVDAIEQAAYAPAAGPGSVGRELAQPAEPHNEPPYPKSLSEPAHSARETKGRSPGVPAGADASVTTAVQVLRTSLRTAAARRARLRARWWPRSLLVRPGSVFAASGSSEPTR